MAEVPKTIKQWQMVQPTVFNRETKETTPGKLAMAEIPVPELKDGEVLVKSPVAAYAIPTLAISTTAFLPSANHRWGIRLSDGGNGCIAGDPAWVGKEVVIPAVMPCRQCVLCKTGRATGVWPRKCPATRSVMRWICRPYRCSFG